VDIIFFVEETEFCVKIIRSNPSVLFDYCRGRFVQIIQFFFFLDWNHHWDLFFGGLGIFFSFGDIKLFISLIFCLFFDFGDICFFNFNLCVQGLAGRCLWNICSYWDFFNWLRFIRVGYFKGNLFG